MLEWNEKLNVMEHPETFIEVIHWIIDVFHDPDFVGAVTDGGVAAAVGAVHSSRDLAHDGEVHEVYRLGFDIGLD